MNRGSGHKQQPQELSGETQEKGPVGKGPAAGKDRK